MDAATLIASSTGRQFWERIFIACIPTMSAQYAAERADLGLAEWIERVNTGKKEAVADVTRL